MVFSSNLFLFYFLPLALLLYYALPRRAKHLGLTVLSYAFYGWANPLFMLILLASTVVDYFCGLAMAGRRFFRDPEAIEALEPGAPRSRRQKLALAISIVSNLSLLGFFKYFNFAVENYDALLAWMGLEALQLDTALRIALPLGISFYTFQSMSYSIDVYRGQAKAQRNFIDFACYVSMFPQLVAGPIIRFREVASQLVQRTHTIEKFARGAAFISLGLAKKILLANPCGKIADSVFEAGSITMVQAWYGASAYAFQIYFDFSAYTDMAIGLGLMLGFVFPKNFDSPYHARSITDFWRRWHISLSTWLRDYLYIPLGGNRRGPTRTAINLGLVMLLGGLWHGASWNFVLWGAMHGFLLGLERIRGRASLYHWLPVPMQVALTFALVLITWVFFRSSDLPSALSYLGAMFGLVQARPEAAILDGIIYQPYYLGTFIAAAIVTWVFPQTWDWTRSIGPLKALLLLLLLLLSVAVLVTQAYNPFIYFIF
ncbi:MAG TPA: MBOAT family O-acyltransferase [Thioalkalivibrio sp.]|nr:MBOAT family O-acyltransferase [Thioalkalivibrio sp.]